MTKQNTKIIIWDFNRTIYNPDTQTLIEHAGEVIQYAQQQKYKNIIFSKNNAGTLPVQQLLATFQLDSFFNDFVENTEKSISTLIPILKKYHVNKKLSFFISDRAQSDIPIGNALGLQTVWFRNGKFANEEPREKSEFPHYTITNFLEFKNILQSTHT